MNIRSGASFEELPAGTVTFLFTDIQDSTQLLHQLGDGYIQLLADHHRILREVFERWHGREVDTEGDAFFVSFSRAADAVAAVVESAEAISRKLARLPAFLEGVEPASI